MNDVPQNNQSPQSPASGTGGIPPSSDENSEAGQPFHKREEQNTQADSSDQSPRSGLPDSLRDSKRAGQAFRKDDAQEGENSRSTSQDDMTQLRSELEESKQKAEEYLNGWKRAQADYQNLKREIEKEKVELAKFANLTLLLELLPILDNFGHAMRHLPEDRKNDEWVKGIQAIEQQFRSILTSMGVTEVPAEGMFNPELHETVDDGDGQDAPPGTILEVIQPGYMLYGRLIRPAKVKVAK